MEGWRWRQILFTQEWNEKLTLHDVGTPFGWSFNKFFSGHWSRPIHRTTPQRVTTMGKIYYTNPSRLDEISYLGDLILPSASTLPVKQIRGRLSYDEGNSHAFGVRLRLRSVFSCRGESKSSSLSANVSSLQLPSLLNFLSRKSERQAESRKSFISVSSCA